MEKNFFDNTSNYLQKNFSIQIRAEIIKKIISERTKISIFDVGCGDGTISLQFLSKSNQITLLDLSENMLSIAQKNIPREFISKVQIIHQDICKLKFKKKFDYVLGIGILAHVKSIEITMKELIKYIKPDGILIIQFSNFENWITKLNYAFSGERKYKLNRIRYHSFKNLIQKLGLIIEKEIQFSFVVPGLGLLPNRLLYQVNKLVYKKRIISRFGSDFMWSLRKA